MKKLDSMYIVVMSSRSKYKFKGAVIDAIMNSDNQIVKVGRDYINKAHIVEINFDRELTKQYWMNEVEKVIPQPESPLEMDEWREAVKKEFGDLKL